MINQVPLARAGKVQVAGVAHSGLKRCCDGGNGPTWRKDKPGRTPQRHFYYILCLFCSFVAEIRVCLGKYGWVSANGMNVLGQTPAFFNAIFGIPNKNGIGLNIQCWGKVFRCPLKCPQSWILSWNICIARKGLAMVLSINQKVRIQHCPSQFVVSNWVCILPNPWPLVLFLEKYKQNLNVFLYF